MNTLSNRRHPILASVLAFSLVVSLCAPPAVAQSGRTHMATDDARRAPKDNGRTNLHAKEPARPQVRDRAKMAPAARGSAKSAPKSQLQAQTPSAPAARNPAPARRDTGVNNRPPAARTARTPDRTPSTVPVRDRGRRDDDRRGAPARPSAASVRPSPPPAPSYAGNLSARGKRVSPAPSRHVVRTGVRDYHVVRGTRHYRRPIIVNRTIHVAPRRVRHYRNVTVVRPYGHWYGGYGRFVSDTDAWAFLALTAITLAIVDSLSESQQRQHEAAQVLATTAPLGETIAWNDGSAAGSVTPLRDGRAEDGEYCREFLQTVTIGGREEEAYGTACLRPDGAWEVVSAGQ
jgi:hypothetical protein